MTLGIFGPDINIVRSDTMLHVQTADKPPDASMEISDRLDLLSLVAVMWGVLAIITASLFGLALAAAKRETGCDYRYVNFDECYTGADILFVLGILLLFVFGAVPIWFLSWSLISVAIFGSETTVRRLRPRIRHLDWWIFWAGGFAWTALAVALAFSSLQPAEYAVPGLVRIEYAVPGILLVAIGVGLAWYIVNLLCDLGELFLRHWHGVGSVRKTR